MILEIDSSDHAFEAIISQYNDDEILYFIVFYSRKFNAVELNYEIYDKKMLIIIKIMDK
jgi:hypothetical protein